MKRNNIFMLAYITFIVLSCILRCITDFSMWSPIVVAVTISSMFFAIEDLFSSISGMYGRLTEIRERGISDIKNKFQQDLAIEHRVAQVYKDNMDIATELKEHFQHFDKLQSYNEEIEAIITSIEKDNEKGKKTHNRYRRLSIVFAYIGFLLLFVSMIIVPYIDVSTKIQELTTVFSFVIILTTNQISNATAETIKEAEASTTSLLKHYDDAITSTQEMETKLYKMIALLKSQKESQEDEENAD